jgi:hypothetical protein
MVDRKTPSKENTEGRIHLVLPRDQAQRLVLEQIQRGRGLPNISINDNEEAHRWYDYTAEVLRQIVSTEEFYDEFTGRGPHFFFGEVTPANYLKGLKSIYERLELLPEDVPPTSRPASPDPLAIIKRLIEGFHRVCRQLRQRHENRPTLDVADEYDAQDLFRALLSIYFDDIRPEEWTPSYAGGSSRMDFLLKTEGIVVEVKKTRPRLEAREVGDQLAIDIIRYRAHPDCKNLICLVYDPEERMSNPKGLEQDLSKSVGEMFVRVYVIQR